MDDPQERVESDSESDQSMDSIEARDFAVQNPDLDDPDSPGSTNNPNLAILAAILKSIPECIKSGDFESISDLLPHQVEVQVATRTVQEEIAVSFQNYMIS